jgi:predicted amidophosphoribosyltransferase
MFFQDYCESCGAHDSVLCADCVAMLSQSEIPPPVVLDGITIRAAIGYTGVARSLVLGLKTRRSMAIADELARLTVMRLDLGDWRGLVTWSPTTTGHIRERGYDQARLLATAIARHTASRPIRLLRRVGSQTQTGASRAERLRGPSFVVRPLLRRTKVVEEPILVVDDVVTTGATLRGASLCLAAAGMAHIRCIAVAATPDLMLAR